MRRLIHRWRTEGQTPLRQAAAFGLGTCIGCTPLFGLHLYLSIAAGWLLGLNRLRVYAASNISNPAIAPFLLFGEIQAGKWLRTGTPYPLSLDAFRAASLWQFGADLVVGSVAVGLALGAAVGAVTYVLIRRAGASPAEAELIETAVDRYVESGAFAWEVANGKIRRDWVYREVLRQGLLPAEGTLLDLGCGRGLMLALIATARDQWQRGIWPPGWPPPPAGLRLCGVDRRCRIVRSARLALGAAACVEEADIGRIELPRCHAVLLFDVLQMMPCDAQERLLARVAAALEPDGVILVREADRAGGWRFRIVHLANWLKGVAEGTLRRRFYFRAAAEWIRVLEAQGLAARCCVSAERRLLANVLLEARRPDGSAARGIRKAGGSEARREH